MAEVVPSVALLALRVAHARFRALEFGNPNWPNTCASCEYPSGTHRTDCDVWLGLQAIRAVDLITSPHDLQFATD